MATPRAKLVVQSLVIRAQAALGQPDPGPAIRAAVRAALATLYRHASGDADALALIRAIEFEADRIETYGTQGLETALARARDALGRPR